MSTFLSRCCSELSAFTYSHLNYTYLGSQGTKSKLGLKGPTQKQHLRRYTKESFPDNSPVSKSGFIYKMALSRELAFANTQLNAPLTAGEKASITNRILKLNPAAPWTDLFEKKIWDIDMFNQPHLPTVVDKLTDAEAFSRRPQQNRYFAFLDMPIKMPGKGWKIPEELKQFHEMIRKAAGFEKMINPNYDRYYAYITVDQRPVMPFASQRRQGWHSDSFVSRETRLEKLAATPSQSIETDSIYLAYDSLPTQFVPGPFPFGELNPDDDTDEILKHFDTIASSQSPREYPPFTLLRIGPDCIHQVNVNKTSTIALRTFVKITFSKEIFNREGNAHNRFFDYNWPMVPRNVNQRNHSNIVCFASAEEEADCLSLTKRELQNAFKETVEWASAPLGYAQKVKSVRAYPATPGELLQTTLDGFVTTVNTAHAGDWKISSPCGDQYFLTTKKLQSGYVYKSSSEESFEFAPKSNPMPYLEIKRTIRIPTDWGSQILRAGDILVKRSEEDIYGILKRNFNELYRRLEDASSSKT